MSVTLIAVVLVCYAAISLLACCMVAGMADEASERLLEREREREESAAGQ